MTERAALREMPRIKPADLEALSDVLSSPDNRLVDGLLDLVEKYGGEDAINRRADEAGQLETRLAHLQDEGSPFLAGIEWLADQRDAGAFVTLPEYRRSVIGPAVGAMTFDEAHRDPRDQRPPVLPMARRSGAPGDREARAHARPLHPRVQHRRHRPARRLPAQVSRRAPRRPY